MKKYLYIIKTQIIKRLTYAFDVYGNILVQTIIMITHNLELAKQADRILIMEDGMVRESGKADSQNDELTEA